MNKQPVSVLFEDIVAAHTRIRPFIKRTPMTTIGEQVFLKGEHHQITKSFKPRGACNAMLRLAESDRQKGVITRSSGNFAQAISHIGQILGVTVTVVMPEHAPKAKIEATKSFGSTVILKGTQHEQAQALVDELADKHGYVKMHPYDNNDVISGQGTAMLEIMEDLPSIDAFFCPVSGGGLMAGCATALKHRFPNATVIAVEPEGACDYANYRKTGVFDSLEKASSIADGLLAPCVGRHCLPLLDAYVDEVSVVSDKEIHASMHALHNKEEFVEPSGAAAYAAYIKQATRFQGKTVVCMGSGGNYDASVL